MKHSKRSFLWYVVVMGCSLALQVWAQPELKNIQKGGKDNKAWVVLTYTEPTRISGISHPDGNTLCVYLTGFSGAYNGEYQDVSGGRSIFIKQASTEPSYAKLTISMEDSATIVVVERNNTVIISFCDEKLKQEALNLPDQLPSGYRSGFLKDVLRSTVKKQEKIAFAFEGGYRWSGFIFNSGREFSLLLSGVSIFTASDLFTYPDGKVYKVSLVSGAMADSSFRSDVELAYAMPFAVTSRGGELTVSTRLNGNTRTAEPLTVTQPVTETPAWENSIPARQTSKQNTDTAVQEPVPAPVQEKQAQPQAGQNVQSTTPVDRRQGRVFQDEPEIPWESIVSFRFNETPIKAALRTIARAVGVNMVIGENVSGSVTMNLEDVTLRQTLNKIVHTHDCDYLVDNGIITIKPTKISYSGGRVTKVYHLKYADANNILPIIQQIVSADSLVHVFHREFLFYDEAGKNRMKKNEVAVQGIRRASMFVVTDRPEKIRQIDRLVAEIDKKPVQFIIRAKLIETAPLTSQELGINWDKTLTTALQWQEMLPGGDANSYSFLNTDVSSNQPWKMGHLSANEFKAVLDFLKEKTDSKIISNPSVVAMDNEESVMSAGQTVPVPRIQRGMGGQGDMVTFDYKEVNIQLNVTPHLSERDIISMYVNPVIEEITGWVELDKNRAPITSKRTVNSIVSVRSGETVVIGGLIKTQKERTESKVWLLGSIPLIGNLFRHESFRDTKTELLIFITPEIVRTRQYD